MIKRVYDHEHSELKVYIKAKNANIHTCINCIYIGLGKEVQTSGGDDGIDVCILRKNFHAFLFAHVENQTFFYHVLHLYTIHISHGHADVYIPEACPKSSIYADT